MNIVNAEVTITFTLVEAVALQKLLGSMSTTQILKVVSHKEEKALTDVYTGLSEIIEQDEQL